MNSNKEVSQLTELIKILYRTVDSQVIISRYQMEKLGVKTREEVVEKLKLAASVLKFGNVEFEFSRWDIYECVKMILENDKLPKSHIVFPGIGKRWILYDKLGNMGISEEYSDKPHVEREREVYDFIKNEKELEGRKIEADVQCTNLGCAVIYIYKEYYDKLVNNPPKNNREIYDKVKSFRVLKSIIESGESKKLSQTMIQQIKINERRDPVKCKKELIEKFDGVKQKLNSNILFEVDCFRKSHNSVCECDFNILNPESLNYNSVDITTNIPKKYDNIGGSFLVDRKKLFEIGVDVKWKYGTGYELTSESEMKIYDFYNKDIKTDLESEIELDVNCFHDKYYGSHFWCNIDYFRK